MTGFNRDYARRAVKQALRSRVVKPRTPRPPTYDAKPALHNHAATDAGPPALWSGPRSRPSRSCSNPSCQQHQRCCVTHARRSPRSRTSPRPTGARSGAPTRVERLKREVKRRTDVVGIFPNPAALLRLSTCVLIESQDEWQVAKRRYLSEESMAQLTPPTPTAITANSNDQEVIDTDAIRTA